MERFCPTPPLPPSLLASCEIAESLPNQIICPGHHWFYLMCVMVGRPGQVAVDWMTGNLYYTQDGSPFITVCSRKKACLKIIRVSHPVLILMFRIRIGLTLTGSSISLLCGSGSGSREPNRCGSLLGLSKILKVELKFFALLVPCYRF